MKRLREAASSIASAASAVASNIASGISFLHNLAIHPNPPDQILPVTDVPQSNEQTPASDTPAQVDAQLPTATNPLAGQPSRSPTTSGSTAQRRSSSSHDSRPPKKPKLNDGLSRATSTSQPRTGILDADADEDDIDSHVTDVVEPYDTLVALDDEDNEILLDNSDPGMPTSNIPAAEPQEELQTSEDDLEGEEEGGMEEAVPQLNLSPYVFPDYEIAWRRRTMWNLSLASICSKKYNIQSIAHFRACLLAANAGSEDLKNKIIDFTEKSNRVTVTLQVFKMLHVLNSSPVQDHRALELVCLLSGGFYGEADIPFPTKFADIQGTVQALHANGGKQVIPLNLLRNLTRSEDLASDDTALCFVFCTIYQCRVEGNLGDYDLLGLYEKFVPLLNQIYKKLDKFAKIAGCDNWGALVSPYLYFDVGKVIMTVYKRAKRAEPQHRISITGEIRPELNGNYVPSDFEEQERVVAALYLPSDRSRTCEAAVRKAVRLFGEIQQEFANHLPEAIGRRAGRIPAAIRALLDEIRASLCQAFPSPSRSKIIPPPPGRLSMTPIPAAISSHVAMKLKLPLGQFAGPPDKWAHINRRSYACYPEDELKDLEFNRLHLTLRTLPGGVKSVVTKKKFNKGDPISPLYGNITHESLKERPTLIGNVSYGLSHSNVLRRTVEHYGISLVNHADLELKSTTELGFSDT